MDGLYARRAQDMAPFLQEYTKERDLLEQMTRERAVDEATFSLQISKTGALWQKINDSGKMMSYRVLRVLDADQYKKLLTYLDKLQADWGSRGRSGAPHPSDK
jgi:hypothetical protein